MKIGIIGAGGQARVINEILHYSQNFHILAFIDQPLMGEHETISDIPVVGNRLGDPDIISRLINEGMEGFIVAVGDNKKRSNLYSYCINANLQPINAIHPTAHIAGDAKIGCGNVIAIGGIICTCAEIGNNVIINSGVIVDHECKIHDHVHLAPGVILAGKGIIESGAFVGAGVTIKERIVIGKNSIIGAGSIVLENIPENTVAVGSPARVIKTLDSSVHPFKMLGQKK